MMRCICWDELTIKHDSAGCPFIDALPESMRDGLDPDDSAWIISGINESLRWCHEHK